MKIRNGFVSNSSSSSFLIALARIRDVEMFDQYMSDHAITVNNYEMAVRALMDIKATSGTYSDLSISERNGNTIMSIDSFGDGVAVPITGLSDRELFVVVNISNDEGDSAFMDESDEIDYDIDMDFFPDNQRKIYAMFFDDKSGLDININQARYGAERNG